MAYWNENKVRKLALAKILMLFGLGVLVIAISDGRSAATSPSSASLETIAKIDLGVRELSGIALRALPGTATEVELVGIGDKGGQVARLPLSLPHPENLAGREPVVVDLEALLLATLSPCDPTVPERCAPAMRQAAAQWEALATDASGRLYALQETHDVLVGLAPGLDRVEVVVHLDFGKLPTKGKSSAKHAKKRNSRGEGLVLLKGGHVLVAIESKPAFIVELGPEGDAALGYSPSTRLSPGESFAWAPTPTPVGAVPRSRLVALARWRLGDDRRGCDAADLALDDAGRLLVLSQSCSEITTYEALVVSERQAKATERLELPRGIRFAEALAALPGGRFLVGEDVKTRKMSLHVLQTPEVARDFAALVEGLLPRI